MLADLETDSIDKLSATSGSRAGDTFNMFVLDDGVGIASDPAEPETCQSLVKAESLPWGMRRDPAEPADVSVLGQG